MTRPLHRPPSLSLLLALPLAFAACGAAPPPASGSAEAPCHARDDARADGPVTAGPTPKVQLTCEVAVLETPAGGEPRETIVSRPRITTLVGRPATIESRAGATPQRGERLVSVELSARTAGPTFDLVGAGRLSDGARALVEAATDPDAAPAATLRLRFAEPGAAEAWEIRCQAGDPG
ncbi:hypothetical protein L6V77_28595 [Myxococcota bacterium]|nr:hypothetical protein [Myxococcota bacterium]